MLQSASIAHAAHHDLDSHENHINCSICAIADHNIANVNSFQNPSFLSIASAFSLKPYSNLAKDSNLLYSSRAPPYFI